MKSLHSLDQNSGEGNEDSQYINSKIGELTILEWKNYLHLNDAEQPR